MLKIGFFFISIVCFFLHGCGEKLSWEEKKQLKIIRSGKEKEIIKVAMKTNLTLPIQILLARSNSESVGKALAANPTIADTVQLLLSRNNMFLVKLVLASNKNITNENINAEAQEILAKNSSEAVRVKLKDNPNLSSKVRIMLSGTAIP